VVGIDASRVCAVNSRRVPGKEGLEREQYGSSALPDVL
jgi:hypothetical protein